MMRKVLKKFSVKIVLPILFVLSSIVGFFIADTLGTGHSLVSSLFVYGAAWYILVLLFLIRAIGMMICNTSGATGGIFLPTLAFGAIIGAICADIMIKLGWIQPNHYILMVILGIASFLGATSRIPLTASVFAIETLGGMNNVLPIVIATTVALIVVEASGLEDLTDMVIDAKLHKITKGKQPLIVEVSLNVARDSFIVGKEMRDVLWPNSCVVISFLRDRADHVNLAISEGDIITVRYSTYHPAETISEFTALVGEQSEDIIRIMNPTPSSDK
jgi:CIC family chloride channel protein